MATPAVSWEYFDQQYKPYSPQDAYTVEQQYQALGPNGKFMLSLADGSFTYEINFQTMTQRNVATNSSRQIRRVVLGPQYQQQQQHNQQHNQQQDQHHTPQYTPQELQNALRTITPKTKLQPGQSLIRTTHSTPVSTLPLGDLMIYHMGGKHRDQLQEQLDHLRQVHPPIKPDPPQLHTIRVSEEEIHQWNQLYPAARQPTMGAHVSGVLGQENSAEKKREEERQKQYLHYYPHTFRYNKRNLFEDSDDGEDDDDLTEVQRHAIMTQIRQFKWDRLVDQQNELFLQEQATFKQKHPRFNAAAHKGKVTTATKHLMAVNWKIEQVNNAIAQYQQQHLNNNNNKKNNNRSHTNLNKTQSARAAAAPQTAAEINPADYALISFDPATLRFEHQAEVCWKIKQVLSVLPTTPNFTPITISTLPLSDFDHAAELEMDMNNSWQHDDDCTICFCPMSHHPADPTTVDPDDKVTVLPCSHAFHVNCLTEHFDTKGDCPVCRAPVFLSPGPSPAGTVTITHLPQSCAGHEAYGTLQLAFSLSGGVQDDRHSNPGGRYAGTQRVHFMPANPVGFVLLKLYIKAFMCSHMFSVGRSLTQGIDNMIIYGGIHCKSSMNHPTHGFPDPKYQDTALAELRDAGFKLDEL